MRNMSIMNSANSTSLENLRSLLGGKQPAWMPFTLDVGAMPGFTPPVQRKFQQETGANSPAEYFRADIRTFSLGCRYGGNDPAALYKTVEPGTTFDEWGIGHLSSATEAAVDRMFSPLAEAETIGEVEALPSPIVVADVDYGAVASYHAAGYPVFGYAGSLYEWSWWLRGMEKFLMDMVAAPAMVETIVAKVEAHTTRLAVASARAGIDVLCMYDDVGTQRGMQISPQLWRRFFKPGWKRVIEAARRESPGARFFLHSCGKIDQIVPDIIEVGFDILHPLQPECMSFEQIYRQYGGEIVLAATISAQRLFPFGSPREIRREVQRLAKIAADSRRCIFMPSNTIQPETPWENVLAFADEVQALRRETLNSYGSIQL